MPTFIHQHLPVAPFWQLPNTVHAPHQIMDWLLDTGSLTQRLMQHGNFSVQPQKEWVGDALPSEYELLALAPEKALIREVVLMLDQEPAVLARSVIPESTLVGDNLSLSQMANRSLGSELFQTPKAIREQLWLTQLDADHPLGALWGRQSRFSKRGKPLLVAEYFLPALWARLGVN